MFPPPFPFPVAPCSLDCYRHDKAWKRREPKHSSLSFTDPISGNPDRVRVYSINLAENVVITDRVVENEVRKMAWHDRILSISLALLPAMSRLTEQGKSPFHAKPFLSGGKL